MKSLNTMTVIALVTFGLMAYYEKLSSFAVFWMVLIVWFFYHNQSYLIRSKYFAKGRRYAKHH